MSPIFVGEDISPAQWAPLPAGDRLVVGGTTVWLGPFARPLVVAQPNRWGYAEPGFPPVPCLVEADPAVAGLLPLPAEVVGWVDRAHRPLEQPLPTAAGRRLLEAARRLGKLIDLIRGVRMVAPPTARTVAFLTPVEPALLIDSCREELDGLRPLEGLAGAVAAVVGSHHTEADLEGIAAGVRRGLERAGG